MRLRVKLLVLALLLVLLVSTAAVAVSTQDRSAESAPSKAADVTAAPSVSASRGTQPPQAKQLQSSPDKSVVISAPLKVPIDKTGGVYTWNITGKATCGSGNPSGMVNLQRLCAGSWKMWTYTGINADGSFKIGMSGDPFWYCYDLNQLVVQFRGVWQGRCSDESQDSLTYSNTLTVTFVKPEPVAEAGPNQNVNAGTLVTLDGSKSTCIFCPLTYAWTFSTKPVGSTATLSGATTVKPTFKADKAGTYIMQLVVKDNKGVTSTADTVTVKAVSPPVANAGPNQNVQVGMKVTLDGSKSSASTYAWTLSTKPAGSIATLSGPTTVKPTFTPDKQGTYVATLTVKNSLGTSSKDTVIITVLPKLLINNVRPFI